MLFAGLVIGFIYGRIKFQLIFYMCVLCHNYLTKDICIAIFIQISLLYYRKPNGYNLNPFFLFILFERIYTPGIWIIQFNFTQLSIPITLLPFNTKLYF